MSGKKKGKQVGWWIVGGQGSSGEGGRGGGGGRPVPKENQACGSDAAQRELLHTISCTTGSGCDGLIPGPQTCWGLAGLDGILIHSYCKVPVDTKQRGIGVKNPATSPG